MTISRDFAYPKSIPTGPLRNIRSYWDPDSDCRVTATTPELSPDLWNRFLAGARDSYGRFGVSSALEYEEIRDGSTTSLFFVAQDRSGIVLSGVRAQGPFTAANQTHADVEWEEHPAGRLLLRNMINRRIPEGVVEIKAGWVAEGAPHSKALAYMVGQSPLYAAALLGTRYALATAAAHVLNAWRNTGAVVARTIDPIPYPNDKYLTNVIWWDRKNNAVTAAEEQQKRIDMATEALLHDSGPYAGVAA